MPREHARQKPVVLEAAPLNSSCWIYFTGPPSAAHARCFCRKYAETSSFSKFVRQLDRDQC